MSTYLWDASALCKRYFVNEIGAAWVNATIDDTSHTHYMINLTIPEILNAFYRVHREGHVTEAERDALIAGFYDDIVNGMLLVQSVGDAHVFHAEPIIRSLQAMTVTKKRPGPVDALLVACALDFDLISLILVSSDVDLNALARQFRITAFDPEHPSHV